MVARAFCELFVAGCLEVESREVGGDVQRLYRVADDIDVSLLGRMERMAREETRELPRREAELLAEMGEVIDDALEYLPPACSCSI